MITGKKKKVIDQKKMIVSLHKTQNKFSKRLSIYKCYI